MIKENYLGVNVCNVDNKTVIEEINSIIEKREPSFIVAINPEKIMKAIKDPDLMQLINSATIQIPDGVGVLLASRLRGGKIRKRVTGIDLMHGICKEAAIRGYRVYLLGANKGIAEKASFILKETYSGLNIVGIQDGYYEDLNLVLKDIKEKAPEIIFVAMGSPKQEYWIKANMDKLNVPLLMGVGGSFDVTCGNIKRAPAWMCKLGLEWLFRLIKEPWRITRMMVLPKFLLKVIFKG